MLDEKTDGGYNFYSAQATSNNMLIHVAENNVINYEYFYIFRGNALLSADYSISQQLADRGFMSTEVNIYVSLKYTVENSVYTYFVDQILIVKNE